MSWVYDVSLTTGKDQIRLLIGDIDISDQQLQDEEIAYFISTEANVYQAASRCAMALCARYRRKADSKQVGDLKLVYKSTADGYAKLSDELQSRGMTHQIPSAGGIKVGEQSAYENNTGLRHNAIKRGMNDYVAPSPLPNTEGN